jgi:hypothetical protein
MQMGRHDGDTDYASLDLFAVHDKGGTQLWLLQPGRVLSRCALISPSDLPCGILRSA